jgi:serine/threonine protein kinase
MSEQEQRLAADTVLEGRYRLLSEGTAQDLGMGYKAYDLQRDRPVFLLVLSPRWGGGVDALSRLEEFQQAVSSLTTPDLLPFEYVGLSDGHLYLVRAQTEGQSLADLLTQAHRLDISMAVEITIRICEALAPAHGAGLVHGSLSPNSVLVKSATSTAQSSGPTITVIDVGLLPALRPGGMPKGQPWGRSPYLSPEQARGEQAHPASDVYVIGCLLYEMLTGRPPFRAGDDTILALQHQRQEPPSLQVLLPHIPPAVAQIVHQALAKEPAARYRNAGQLAHILKARVELHSPSPPPEPSRSLQAPAQERLVVPPPPTPAPPDLWSSRDIYALDGDANWLEEPAGTDWLVIGLLIAALIAVLGLIPLWRTVYRRYAPSPPATSPGSDHRFGLEFSASQTCSIEEWLYQAQGEIELDERAFVWYNILSPGLCLARSASESGACPRIAVAATIHRFGSQAYGFQGQSVVNCMRSV